MVGNDVVDLNDRDADPRTLHPRFDARVFSAEELERLSGSARPVQLRWRMWAAKEAAYKAVSKAQPGIVFSPSRFQVELSQPVGADRVETGVVSCSAGRCQLTLAESDAAIHAVAYFDAALSSFDAALGSEAAGKRAGSARRGDSAARAKLLRGQLRVDPAPAIDRDPDAPSRVVRDFSRVRLASLLGVDVDTLEIRRRGRIPELWLRGEPAEADLSLSHHGAVVAFACEVPPPGLTSTSPRESV